MLRQQAVASAPQDSAELQHLLSMGFSRDLCAEALRLNANNVGEAISWLMQTVALFVSGGFSEDGSKSPRCILLHGKILQSQPTPGDGNCLFHALFHSLHHLCTLRNGNLHLPNGPLPRDYVEMRCMVVDFARSRKHLDIFYESGQLVNLEQQIAGDVRKGVAIVGAGAAESVDHYFEVGGLPLFVLQTPHLCTAAYAL
jgi:hypothetical protein